MILFGKNRKSFEFRELKNVKKTKMAEEKIAKLEWKLENEIGIGDLFLWKMMKLQKRLRVSNEKSETLAQENEILKNKLRLADEKLTKITKNYALVSLEAIQTAKSMGVDFKCTPLEM